MVSSVLYYLQMDRWELLKNTSSKNRILILKKTGVTTNITSTIIGIDG